MRKQIWVIALMLFITGCSSSISQEAYDELEEENNLLSEQVSSLETDINLLEQTNQTLTEDQVDMVEQINDLGVSIEDYEISMEDTIATYEGIIAELEEIETVGPTQGAALLTEASNIMTALSINDMATVALYVDPSQGLRFSPYQYVDVTNDVVLSQGDVANFFSLPTVYNWGAYDGTGFPIDLNTTDYYYEFVYDEDYIAAPYIGQNMVLSFGNTINNITTVYTGASFVEFYYEGFNPIYEGMDWSSMTLVMELQGTQWYLVGIVNGQWTI